MKIISFIVFFISVSGQAQWQPQCESSDTYCLYEFEQRVAQADSIAEAVELLPNHVLQNLTFKRGVNINKTLVGHLGPHGHKVSSQNSSSATAEQPRVFVWDESSAFTASWNSGNPNHAAFDRIDLYDFDFTTKKHRLAAWFPKAVNGEPFHDANFVDSKGRSCTQCHGEVQRPIFPMYPDWPQFYGEFNDEMTGYPSGALAIRADLRTMANDFQPRERALYLNFLENEAETNPRYTPLYEVRREDHAVYPFRPATTTSPFSNVSRAFYHRPNLRLGLVYNRVTALQTFEKIKEASLFKKFPDIIFYSLLDCNWDFVEGHGQAGRRQILDPFLAEAHQDSQLQDINLRGVSYRRSELSSSERASAFRVNSEGQTRYYMSPAYDEAGYMQIPYEDLLRLLKLNIADLDIRFRHDSSHRVDKGYNVYDPKAYHFTDNAMDIGYLAETYAMNPICDNGNNRCNFGYQRTYMDGMKYFNSYFDGSATMNELLVAQMLIYLTNPNEDFSQEPDLAEVRSILRGLIPDPDVYFETLMKKYSRFTARLRLDRPFFEKMDGMSPWIQLPYPPDLLNIHNRESYWRNGRECTRGVCQRHAMWTTRANRRNNVQNKNGGNNICWNVYTTMHRRYRQ